MKRTGPTWPPRRRRKEGLQHGWRDRIRGRPGLSEQVFAGRIDADCLVLHWIAAPGAGTVRYPLSDIPDVDLYEANDPLAAPFERSATR